MLGSTEQAGTDRAVEVETKIELLRELLERRGLRSVALSDAASVAWITGGLTNRIEPGNPGSPLWIVVGPDAAVAVTTNVERPRLEAEAELPFELHDVPWHEPGGFERLAAELAGAPRAERTFEGGGRGDRHRLQPLALGLQQREPQRHEIVLVEGVERAGELRGGAG